MDAGIVIIGGGLAGLYAARLLHEKGADFILMEARQRLGGRIYSVNASGSGYEDRYDLGPSWLWPEMQPGLAALIGELNLRAFPQHSVGDVLLDTHSSQKPQRYPGMAQVPASMRLVGGMGSLVEALACGIPDERIKLDSRVCRLALHDRGVQVGFLETGGREPTLVAERVIAAVPPRLLLSNVEFEPDIDRDTARLWRDTATWMAPHAKFFALYERPFWREAGLSGTARSMVGPLAEIHDATTVKGEAALFGFVGLDWHQRHEIGETALMEACVEQLGRIFGPAALNPKATLFKDWADDLLTATSDDRIANGHPVPYPGSWVTGIWEDRLSLAGSETSTADPGYLAGAVNAARRAVSEVIPEC